MRLPRKINLKNVRLKKMAVIFAFLASACGISQSAIIPITGAIQVAIKASPMPKLSTKIDAATPCLGRPAPVQWHHVVVIMFENKTYNEVMGTSPYITNLANQCGTYDNWQDADFKVNGTQDGNYKSKPNYATLTSGLSPSMHGLVNDHYDVKTNVDNIYHQLALTGQSFKDYYAAGAGGCSIRFSGDYHDPLRYYTNMVSSCDEHDVPLSTFVQDLKSGNLPAYSMILPTNNENMHNNSISSGDKYAQTLLDPLLNSPAYAKGDVAVFLLWDEDTPIPNVLIAPSIVPGSKVPVPGSNPISHFSALRTWEDMLHLPLLGDTRMAPSLLQFFGKP